MNHIVRVNVVTGSCAELIDGGRRTRGARALIGASARAGSLECREVALRISHETVLNEIAAVVLVTTGDRSNVSGNQVALFPPG